MADVMAALDPPDTEQEHISFMRNFSDIMYALKEKGCTDYKVHLPASGVGLDLKATLNRARHSVLPGLRSRVLLDNKWGDTGPTVVGAVTNDLWQGAHLVTIHAMSSSSMFVSLQKAKLIDRVIAVTVPTWFTDEDVRRIFNRSREEALRELSLHAAEHGITQFVCGARDIRIISRTVGKLCRPQFFVPGIRMPDDPTDNQVNRATPKEACDAGADVLIVGRPITRTGKPKEIAERFEMIRDIAASRR